MLAQGARDQLAHEAGRTEVQLAADQCRISSVHPHRLGEVALGEVGPDQEPMGTFAQRLGPGGDQGQLNRPRGPVVLDQQLSEPVDRLQPALPEPLPLVEQPVVGVVDQQAADRRDECVRCPQQFGFRRFRAGRAVHEPADLVNVDHHVAVQPQVRPRTADQRR